MKISSLLKQLFVALALVGGVGAAQAVVTDYNFSFNSANDAIGSGTLENSNGTWSLINSTFTVSNSYPGGQFTANTPISMYSPTSVTPSGVPTSFMFVTNTTQENTLTFTGGLHGFGQFTTLSYGDPSNISISSTNNSSGISLAGAPEIDGSLAPKVGFLLGCLFLMFGRKKQNTEPMMMA